jgi:hypothetical protein
MYAKLSDEFCIHPKILKLGNEAVGVYARMISYCGRGTDGEVPGEMVTLFTASNEASVEKLTAAGLIKPQGDDWLVVNFKKHNITRAQWERRKKADRERKRKERDSDKESRRDSVRSHA